MKHSASDRLVETAARLFQERGYALVGINEIIAEAGVARMSLYNNFGSKQELAVAAYEALSETRQAGVDRAIEVARSPEEAVAAIFDLARNLAAKPDFRGCAFINLAAHIGPEDAQLARLVTRHKAALHSRFESLAQKLGASNPETLAHQLLALWDGAIVEAAITKKLQPIDAARSAALDLIAAASGGSGARQGAVH